MEAGASFKAIHGLVFVIIIHTISDHKLLLLECVEQQLYGSATKPAESLQYKIYNHAVHTPKENPALS